MTKKRTPSKKSVASQKAASKKMTFREMLSGKWRDIVVRCKALMARRPHRSFKQTLRRDYERSLKLPGYWAFTNYVRKTFFAYKKLFLLLALFYGALTYLLIGLVSQDSYLNLADTLRETGNELFNGAWGELGKATLLLASGITGNFNDSLTETQLVYSALIGLLTWLTAVWLLRSILSGNKPRLRDGVYNSGAPIVPLFLVFLVILVQLIPVALAAAAFSAALATNLIADGGVEAMLLWAAIAVLAGLSIYWITSTVVALVVVTLPGMYPLQAVKIAGDMVVGRRVRILLRLLWLGLTIAVSWLVIMVPILLFDTWLKGIAPATEWIPIVPISMIAMSSLTVVWTSGYTYLLYRKVVDDDAAPA